MVGKTGKIAEISDSYLMETSTRYCAFNGRHWLRLPVDEHWIYFIFNNIDMSKKEERSGIIRFVKPAGMKRKKGNLWASFDGGVKHVPVNRLVEEGSLLTRHWLQAAKEHLQEGMNFTFLCKQMRPGLKCARFNSKLDN